MIKNSNFLKFSASLPTELNTRITNIIHGTGKRQKKEIFKAHKFQNFNESLYLIDDEYDIDISPNASMKT